MFESLSDRFEGIFTRLRGKGRLSEADVDEVLREIRVALLEADVNLAVARGFVARVKERAVGQKYFDRLSVRAPMKLALYGYAVVPVYRYVNEAQLAPRTGFVLGVSRTF